MTMSSYLINPNYIEPSFPPCEEYEENSFISSDYYERSKEPEFSHHEGAAYPSYDYSDVSTDGLVGFNDRIHIPPRSAPPNPGPQPGTEGCTTTTNKNCSPVNEAYSDPHKGKEPVVYPWMKKVHVNSCEYMSRSINPR